MRISGAPLSNEAKRKAVVTFSASLFKHETSPSGQSFLKHVKGGSMADAVRQQQPSAGLISHLSQAEHGQLQLGPLEAALRIRSAVDPLGTEPSRVQRR